MAVKKSNTKFWKVLSVFRCMFKFRKLKHPVTLSYVYNTTDRMKTACVEATHLQQNQIHPCLDTQVLCHERAVIA